MLHTHHVPRPDAITIGHGATLRAYVPTVYSEKSGNTIWIETVQGWRDAGGCLHFNEDQTEITFSLPVGHKFGIRFDPGASPALDALARAERFIAGFEGDELQEGVDDLLSKIRAIVGNSAEVARLEAIGYTRSQALYEIRTRRGDGSDVVR